MLKKSVSQDRNLETSLAGPSLLRHTRLKERRNETAALTTLGYLSGMHAPGQSGINKFLASVHHACLCQAEGGRIIRNNIKESHIGTTFSCTFTEPYKSFESHYRAARRLDVMLNRLFIESSLGLGYPYEDLPFLRKIDKYIQPVDREKLKFD